MPSVQNFLFKVVCIEYFYILYLPLVNICLHDWPLGTSSVAKKGSKFSSLCSIHAICRLGSNVELVMRAEPNTIAALMQVFSRTIVLTIKPRPAHEKSNDLLIIAPVSHSLAI